MTAPLSITALGTGDAFSAERYSTCLLVETAKTKVLVDCPHPIRRVLRESTRGRVDVGDIDAVVLTHLHADHSSGVEGMAWFCRFALGRPLKLYAHDAVLAGLWPQLAPSMSELLITDADNRPHHRERLTRDDVIAAASMALERPTVIGDLTLDARLTIHHIPTTALVLRAGGACVGYSADTAFDESLLSWLDVGDVIIHETNFGAHTPFSKLAALPSALRDKLRLVHWPDGFDAGDSGIRVLQDGDVVSVAAGSVVG